MWCILPVIPEGNTYGPYALHPSRVVLPLPITKIPGRDFQH